MSLETLRLEQDAENGVGTLTPGRPPLGLDHSRTVTQ